MKRNEYGNKLDKNGYSESLLNHDDCCIRCGKGGDLARHEVFAGNNRQISKRFGMWVNICPNCHRLIHRDRNEDLKLKRIAQSTAMLEYGLSVEQFRAIFGKNWL